MHWYWKLFLVACVNVLFGQSKEVQRWCLQRRALLHFECARRYGYRCILIAIDTELNDHVFFYHENNEMVEDIHVWKLKNPTLIFYQTIMW